MSATWLIIALLFGFTDVAAALETEHDRNAACSETRPHCLTDCEASVAALQIETQGHGPVFQALVRDLVIWIGEKTDYDVLATLADPPDIRFCQEGTAIDYEDESVLVDARLRAAYDLKHRRIHLVEPWDVENLQNVSTLLHELIHDVQHLNRDWACKGEPEWQAYKLQEAWLAEQGIETEFDWMYIFVLSRCPRDIHPD